MSHAVAKQAKLCPACRAQYPDEALFCPNDGSPLVTKLPDDHDAPPSRPDPYLGRTILDHIEIGELVGIGAMGRVYRAFQKGIDRDVAVKVLHRELSANPQLVARFLREAKVASRLQHPNVVNVLLSGQLPDGALYIVMEYLHGLSLQSAIAQAGGAFDLPRALHVSLQLCDAVGEAHVQGIVHRDLKPENVMLVRRGQDADFVKVLDFGIARLNWSEQSMATATGLIFGTARYISPEGAQGDKVGPPGDVYSIATLVYQILAGRTPFEGDQAVGLLIQQIHEAPPPLRSHARAREVPPAIADVVMRGLAKDPNARYDGARAFGRALVEAARASGVSADDYYARSLYAAGSPGSNRVPIAPASSSRDLGDMPVAGPTARWTPPAAVKEQLDAIAAARRPSTPEPTSPVDATLDDDDQSTAHATRDARTEYVTPAPTPTPLGSGTVRMPLQSSPGSSPQPLGLGKGSTLPLDNDAPRISDRVLATPIATPAPSRPRLPSEPTGDHARSSAVIVGEPVEQRSRGGFTIAIVVLCFLIGVGGALGLHKSGVLARFGIGAPAVAAPGLDAHVAHTREAIERERWDEPPGDNVRELVTVGLQRWPNDPRLLALRTQASDAMIRRAVTLKSSGDLPRAARLARVASELVPENDTTRALSAEYAHELESSAAPPLPPVTPAPGPTPSGNRSGGTAPPGVAAKATLETTPAKPRIGQSVQLVARVTARGPVTDGAFVVVAPGQTGPGTRLVPVSEGNTFRAAFSFLEPGRYEVSFTARADGANIKTTKMLLVEGAQAAPPPTDAPPAPAGSVKWL